MRVLLSTYDTRGGVEPLLGVGVQLQMLGAEVVVCAPPDDEFAERAADFGIPLVGFGPSVREVTTGAAQASEEDVRAHVLGLLDAQFDTVAAAAQGCDALVSTALVWTAAGARSVADKLGIHYAYASYHPTHLPSPYHPPPEYVGRGMGTSELDNRVMWNHNARNANALFGPALNGHRAAIGLPPVSDVRGYAYTDHPWLAADPTLGPWQPLRDLSVVQTGAWVLHDDRPLSAELEEFLDAGTPPVYVGFGSMPLWGSKDAVPMAIEAIRAQGRRVLLSRGWADLVPGDDHDDCMGVGEVNQQALFGRVAAVVHHGGAGTTTTAAQAGVPQLVVPQGADQVYWACRVAELGIGTACDGPTPPPGSLPAALEVTLADDTRTRAKAVAAQTRTDGAAMAAKLLLDAVSRATP
ncbi:glycosyl transferase [Mycobacterium florentinum]|uniref:Glycosyl transferase n=1 Tax=Mycobacterium florentinum TaxID=292462 RepID=A0A1X1TUM7_MYCFL|nr:glycosyltransferase [Mycobacterium florentinum]MCV7408895.1 glycosyltransferase family 1 protein [Mycobacterium florentinum]ORV48292.1 glycosyl transferase [Mycobacterium florentinum]BBX77689.1 glycosyl transferase [Mycobacterium florentinum]